MNKTILEGFISKLDFISEITKYSSNNAFKIENLSIDIEKKTITGILIIKNESEIDKGISFETKFNQSDEILIFKTIYQNNHDQSLKEETIDTFAIIAPEGKNFFTPRIKYLIHLAGETIKQAYVVNKKYSFSNGISENYTKLNMDNKDTVNNINNLYSSNKSRK